MNESAVGTRRRSQRGLRARLLTALGAVALIGAACSSPAASGGGSGDPYQIGFTSDLSGTFGFIGNGFKNGVTLYMDALNAAGGVNGHKVNVTYLDDTNDATKGIANATQLITQNKVSSMMGFQSSVVSAAVAPVVAQNNTPMLTNTVSAALVQPVLPFLFASTVQTANYAAPQVQQAKALMDKAGNKTPKVAILYVSNSAALQQWGESVKAMADSLGWQTVASEVVPQANIDMSASLAKIEAANPDVLLMAIGQDAWIIAGMKTVYADGKTFPIVSYDSPAWATVKAVANPRFYYVSALSYANEALTPQFYKDATAAKVDPNGVYIVRGYYQGIIISDALKRCGFPCAGQQMRDSLEKTDVDTGGITQGHAKYDPTSHEGVRNMAAFQWDTAKDAPVIVASDLKPGTKLAP